MFIAMNRFRVARGREAEFEEVWRSRPSRIADERPEPRLSFSTNQSDDNGEGQSNEPDGSDALPDAVAAALKGQTVKTRRTFASPTTGAATQFATIISPWYVADRKVVGITITIGWSEIAVLKRATAAPQPVEDFDGSLLDMLKTVS